MKHKLPYPEEEHQARMICGDPIALSYEWLKSYLENLNSQIDDYDGSEVSFDELIDTGISHISNDRYGGDYIIRGGRFEGISTDPTFWDKLAQFKQINIPQNKRGNFFRCSC